MKIEDCKTLLEFFGVEEGQAIWINGRRFRVDVGWIRGYECSSEADGQALVGCLTGQLEWSTEEPTKDEEEQR